MEMKISPKAMQELLNDSIVDFTKPFNPSDYTFNNDITITEDQAMSMGIEIKYLIHMKCKEGYTVLHEYQHPAVGLVVVMRKDYSLAP